MFGCKTITIFPPKTALLSFKMSLFLLKGYAMFIIKAFQMFRSFSSISNTALYLNVGRSEFLGVAIYFEYVIALVNNTALIKYYHIFMDKS